MLSKSHTIQAVRCRLRLKCDGTRAETKFRLSAERTSPFKSAGVSVQSPTGSRGVRISGCNAGYTMFRCSVKGAGYPLHSPVSPSLPLPCVTVCHHISTGLYHLLLFFHMRPADQPTITIQTTEIHGADWLMSLLFIPRFFFTSRHITSHTTSYYITTQCASFRPTTQPKCSPRYPLRIHVSLKLSFSCSQVMKTGPHYTSTVLWGSLRSVMND